VHDHRRTGIGPVRSFAPRIKVLGVGRLC
jgi:hypothetical protein